MTINNRIAGLQADFLFMIVKRPRGWRPQSPLETPPVVEPLSVDYVASFDEAREEMIRCNTLAIKHNLAKWAVVESVGGNI